MQRNWKRERESLINSIIAKGYLKTPKIVEAFRKIPRHFFVTEEFLHSAYHDIALPTIGTSTISQPTTVAIMTEALSPKEGEKILEVGTGSGWQACILAYCVGEKGRVITIEINPRLVEFAKRNIAKVGIKNVKVVLGDGSLGYPEEAPFDKIMVTAASPSVPKPLLEQLKVGGRLVIPVGDVYSQRMMVIDKKSEDEFEEKDLGEFVFVKLRGKYGFKD